MSAAAVTPPSRRTPEPKVTKIPALSREESLEFWGLSTSHHWAELDAVSSLSDHGWEGDGWIITNPSEGGQWPLGLTAHRRVTQDCEHIDYEQLCARVEDLFGFTAEQVREAFANGRPTKERLALRDQIDARLLELADSGGNVLELARALGLTITDDGSAPNCRSIERSLARARKATCAP